MGEGLVRVWRLVKEEQAFSLESSMDIESVGEECTGTMWC